MAMEEMVSCGRRGDVEGLYSLIQHHPRLLRDMDETQFVHTPLHEAAAAGQTSFAIEIMNLMPSFNRRLNPRGLSPLHLAVESDNKHTALALLKLDPQVVRVKGKYGQTALLYAAQYDDDELLARFLLKCPNSINDTDNRFQSALHLALENNCSRAADVLLGWLERRGQSAVLEWKDDEGNTALHIAVRHNCVKQVKKMVEDFDINFNKRNSQGKSPLDIAQESHTQEIVSVLENAGAKRSRELPDKNPLVKYLCSKLTWREVWSRRIQLIRNMLYAKSDVILVVAVLVATSTYQAVLQPPGGVYQGDAVRANLDAGTAVEMVAAALQRLAQAPGKMVMTKRQSAGFIVANTGAFTLSMLLIMKVLYSSLGFMVHFLYISMIFLAFSYLTGLRFVADDSVASTATYAVSWILIIGAYLTIFVEEIEASLTRSRPDYPFLRRLLKIQHPKLRELRNLKKITRN